MASREPSKKYKELIAEYAEIVKHSPRVNNKVLCPEGLYSNKCHDVLTKATEFIKEAERFTEGKNNPMEIFNIILLKRHLQEVVSTGLIDEEVKLVVNKKLKSVY